MKESIGIVLRSLNISLDKKMIEDFNKIVFTWFEKRNIIPTYWGVDGKGFSSKMTKFSLRKLANLEKKDFLDKEGKLIESICYYIHPLDSDAPAFDEFLNTGIYYSEILSELKITFLINPNIIEIEENEIMELINKFITIFKVDFGYVYKNKDYRHVPAVVFEYDDMKFTEEEYAKFLKWYRYSKEEKLKNIKDIYPLNILSKKYYLHMKDELIKKHKLEEIELFDEDLFCLRLPNGG